MTDRNISCESCRELLSSKFDGEISVVGPAAEAHLEICAACRECRDDLVTVRSALSRWADEHPSANMMPLTRRSALLFRRLAAAAVLVCGIAAGFAAGRATAPKTPENHGAGHADSPPERERYVVPELNEVYSTINIASVATAGDDNAEGSRP